MKWFRIRKRRAHVCPGQEPIGTLTVGEISAEIERVEIKGGLLMVWARAGPGQTGLMKGQAMLTGTDGIAFWTGTRNHDAGIKPAGSVWYVDDAINLAERDCGHG